MKLTRHTLGALALVTAWIVLIVVIIAKNLSR